MAEICATDWGFDDIAAVDQRRARELEAAGTPDELVEALAEALIQACQTGRCRLAVDSPGNTFTELRAIVQFPVTPWLYDWFFNARTGYRSRYWLSPEAGLGFNAGIIGRLSEILGEHLPETVESRRIEVDFIDGSREERDTGSIALSREDVLRSLDPDIAKTWICEFLSAGQPGPSRNIVFASLSEAERSAAKLIVPRWREAREGLRAPRPDDDDAWLDIKGGFIDAGGALLQCKPPVERAGQLHQKGWT